MKTLINLTMRLEDGGIVKDYMYSPITSEQIEEEKKETKYLYGSKVIEIEIIKAEFLAASRTAIPILLDALEAARKARADSIGDIANFEARVAHADTSTKALRG